MKKLLAITLSLLLCLLLFGCDKRDVNSETDNTKELIDLITVSGIKDIDFENTHVEIDIYTDEAYYFSNHNRDFYEKFTTFLKNTKFSSQQMQRTDAKNFYISIYDGENHASFSVYETDIIEETNATKSCYYYCSGIYSEFENTFGAFLEENGRYCRSATTPIRLMNEYAVYDMNNDIIESDYISKTPHLFYDSGIVHLWVQTGTGTLTRYAKFFDVENGLISPKYYGQTDYWGDMVCTTGSSQVAVYKMFSGEQVYCFDSFEKPLADCIENICSAYFSMDGTQIIVEYLNTDFEREKQVLDLQQDQDT